MEVRAQQVIYGVAEAIAAHNLLRYVRNNTDEDKIRMAADASMAGLGYVFGPALQQRLRDLQNDTVDKKLQQQSVYALGGMILGSITGYSLAPKDERGEPQKVQQENAAKPTGLVTIASAGWLGYSLFFDGKTAEEQQRHLWGLGAGVIGYMYGPEILKKLGGILLSSSESTDTIKMYASGAALLGGTIGSVLGWRYGERIFGAP